MWPWQRRMAEAQQQLAEAEERARLSKRLAQKSRTITAELRREVDKNGFTELLQKSMGGR